MDDQGRSPPLVGRPATRRPSASKTSAPSPTSPYRMPPTSSRARTSPTRTSGNTNYGRDWTAEIGRRHRLPPRQVCPVPAVASRWKRTEPSSWATSSSSAPAIARRWPPPFPPPTASSAFPSWAATASAWSDCWPRSSKPITTRAGSVAPLRRPYDIHIVAIDADRDEVRAHRRVGGSRAGSRRLQPPH